MGECLIIRGGGGTDTSNATATASVVLSGYTCYVNDQLIAGSMPVQTLNQKLGAGGSVTIPAGYYDGSSSVISTSTLAEETAANATAAQILSWYTAWVNGGLVQGSMVNWGNTGATLAANGVYWIPAGWHAGAGVVNQSLAVHWGGTYTPNTGNQVMCWAGWYTGGNIVVLGSSALVPWNIRNGVNIFGVWGTFTGFVDSAVGWDATGQISVTINDWGTFNKYDHSLHKFIAFYMDVNQRNRLAGAGFTRFNIEVTCEVTTTEYKGWGFSLRSSSYGDLRSTSIITSASAPANSGVYSLKLTGHTELTSNTSYGLAVGAMTNSGGYPTTNRSLKLRMVSNWCWVSK